LVNRPVYTYIKVNEQFSMRVVKVNVKGNILDAILMACIINHENIHFSTGKTCL